MGIPVLHFNLGHGISPCRVLMNESSEGKIAILENSVFFFKSTNVSSLILLEMSV
ncbi:hypothetical protein JHK82_026624 [Glycine max]|uniref:Uncharacterized protein n=1 Tax=Glycine soja TaxID=3848 RepID=A0A0B2RAS5_GLYSO|nr:hypothetical protein JHK85_027245 [Glycine max]KAG5125789.1 hypothetical protein JHK82_026624 [Glycine max]KHN30655.1 hypothetical protein glysoja_037687 [Glycine soja]